MSTLVCAVLVTAVANAQQTWIVDPNGGGNFTQLAAAIIAATAGDTIVLRGCGQYPGVTISKALAFVGESP